MMTLEEAIKHCKDVALSCTNKECALEHFQLLKWLQEYSNMLEKLGVKDGLVQALEENLLDGTNPVPFGELSKDKDYYPATKEQRDTLEKAMKDAGYAFDFEKKELKRIEQRPAWSEEDEQYLLVCKNALAKYQITDKWDASIISRWLEFLKDRVQPKQEWSKECDEKINFLTNLIRFQVKNGKYSFCYGNNMRFVTKEEAVDMLRSLRPQSQWKPSDEQMDALRYVTNFDYGGHKATLVSLYEQLNKLREE